MFCRTGFTRSGQAGGGTIGSGGRRRCRGSTVYDTVEGHRALVERLVTGYPDGWAMSCTSGNLHDILPLVPKDCRIAAWVKPFAAFKPNVNPAYTWEPVIWRGGRKRDRTSPTTRDYLACSITLKKGLTGAKPERFCEWVLQLLGWDAGDDLDDLFPGTGVMERVVGNLTPAPRGRCSKGTGTTEGR